MRDVPWQRVNLRTLVQFRSSAAGWETLAWRFVHAHALRIAVASCRKSDTVGASALGCGGQGDQPGLACAQGDLALLARRGSRGIPTGHTIAHNADHGLQLKFLRALQEALSDDDYVDVDAPSTPAA